MTTDETYELLKDVHDDIEGVVRSYRQGFIDDLSYESQINTLRELLRLGTDSNDPAELFERLSELIEPVTTYHVEDNLNESDGTGDAWAVCDTCGTVLYVLTDESSMCPRYCPICGRHVTGGDDVERF